MGCRLQNRKIIMFNFNIITIYSLLCTLIPCIVYICFKKKKSYIFFSILYVLYIWQIYDLTGIGSLSDILYSLSSNSEIIKANINLTPLTNITLGFILNIIMFIPLGFLLPFLWKKYQKLTPTLLFGFLFSLFIELSQLITLRATDIDDLIANTLGALIGYLIWKIYMKIFNKSLENPNSKDAFLYIMISYLGTFFFYYPLLFGRLI